MTAKTSILTRTVAAASLVGAMMLTSAAPASAQNFGSGVLNCGAPGTSQPVGAVLGGLLGAALGSNLAKNERTGGAVVGGLAGAAAGSYIGCRQQRSSAAQAQAQGYGYTPARSTGYRAYDRSAAGEYVAGTNVNVRAAPSTSAGRVGQIGAGQSFRAVGRDGGWLVVSNGASLGYVSSSYVRSAGYQQANYGY